MLTFLADFHVERPNLRHGAGGASLILIHNVYLTLFYLDGPTCSSKAVSHIGMKMWDKPQDENSPKIQGSNLLPPVLCCTWISVTNANHPATEPV